MAVNWTKRLQSRLLKLQSFHNRPLSSHYQMKYEMPSETRKFQNIIR